MRSIFLFAGVAALLVLPACGDDSSPSGAQNGLDSGAMTDAQNETDSGATTGDAALPATPGSFRIAHLSPDAPPFDVCIAPTGTTDFQGPLMNAFAAATADATGTPWPDDGGAATGLAYGQVSAYFMVDEGIYDVRLVAAGATSCDAPLGGALSRDAGAQADAAPADAAPTDATLADAASDDAAPADATGDADQGDADTRDGAAAFTTLPSVAIDNSFTTLLVAGELTPSGSDPSLTIAPIADDVVLVSGGASLRAVNALATGAAQDFGFESADGGGFLPIFADVAFARAASQAAPGEPGLDGDGYLAVGEQDGVAFGARASTGSTADTVDTVDTVATVSLQIDLGAVTTIVAIGGDTAGHQPAQLLLCVDNQPSGSALSDCSVLP